MLIVEISVECRGEKRDMLHKRGSAGVEAMHLAAAEECKLRPTCAQKTYASTRSPVMRKGTWETSHFGGLAKDPQYNVALCSPDLVPAVRIEIDSGEPWFIF